MAYNKIHAIHTKANNSSYLKARIDYVIKDGKTKDGEYISSYNCEPELAHLEWEQTRLNYHNFEETNKEEVQAYRVIQSFKGYEVSPKQANEIGHELAMKMTKGNNAFLVATHIDADNIHNHIIWNAFNLDCNSKHKDVKRSWRTVAMLSDEICRENNLSVIEDTHEKISKDYGTWLAIKGMLKPQSHTDKIKKAVDEILLEQPKDFDEFINKLKAKGFEVKARNRTHISVREQGQSGWRRLDTIGGIYAQAQLSNIINNRNFPVSESKYKVKVMVDVEKAFREKGKGYETWASRHNMKQLINTINYMYENKIDTYSELKEKYDNINDRFANASVSKIKSIDSQIENVRKQQQAIIDYSKLKPIYERYKKSGYSKKFKAENIEEITKFENAKQVYKELGVNGKLPTMEELKKEYAQLKIQRNENRESYKDVQEDFNNIANAVSNLETILEINPLEKTKKANGKREEIKSIERKIDGEFETKTNKNNKEKTER